MIVGEVEVKHVWMAGVPEMAVASLLNGGAEPDWIWV